MRRAAIFAGAGAAFAVAVVLAAARVGERAGALSDWQALTLGVVQGFTELLPISSSGHLILVPWIGNWRYLEEHSAFNQTFDVALHLGTLVAVVGYFWHDVVALVAAWVRSVRRRRIETATERVAWVIAVATIPAALIGAAGEDVIAKHLGQPWQIAIFLAVFAIILYIADRSPERRDIDDIQLPTAVAIGFAQALALAPGVSRSGVTISAGRFLGLTRDAAARLSFLLLIPIVLGAVLLKGVKDVALGELPAGWVGPFIVGTIAAAVCGLIAIEVLLGYLRRHDYTIFVIYRLCVSAAVLIVIATGARGSGF